MAWDINLSMLFSKCRENRSLISHYFYGFHYLFVLFWTVFIIFLLRSVMQNSIEKDVSSALSEEQLPFKTALTSFSFSLHQYWFSWLLLATLNYSGSLHLWMERISSDVHIGKSSKNSTVAGKKQIISIKNKVQLKIIVFENILSNKVNY